MARDNYIMPSRRESEDTRLGRLREFVQEGDSFLKCQRGYKDLGSALDILSGDEGEKIPSTLSNLYINRLKRQIREIIAVESNIRPLWGYKCDDPRYFSQNKVLNDLLQGWWLGTFADRSIREALQWAAVLGTGWVQPVWEKGFWTAGRGDIRLHVYGPRDVKPVQIPRDLDIQRAYAVVIATEVPINLARSMYPQYAARIKPDRGEPSYVRRGLSRISKFLSPVLRLHEKESEDVPSGYPTVDIFNAYIMDSAINTSGRVQPMGEIGSNWYYEVPYMGMDIPTNIRDQGGNPLTRKATWEDCRLYPNRRLVTFTNSCILYDDTSPYWSAGRGGVPLVKFTTDDWPWEFLGFSCLRDGQSIQRAINELSRAVQDKVNVSLRPPIGYDPNIVSPQLGERFDPRQPGRRVKMDLSMGEGLKSLLPPELYRIYPEVMQQIQFLVQQQDYMLAIPDMTALAKAQQIPASESVEKILEANGPIVTDISRGMERSLRDLGEMVKVMFFQWYDAKRRFELLGPGGNTVEDYDYDPGSMIPSHLPGEDWTKPSPMSAAERLRKFHAQFSFRVVPNSLHQITQMSRKLMFVQLWRAGYPIDPWTMGEQLDIPFGPSPEGADSIHDRWMAWLAENSQFTATIQALAQVRAASILGMSGMGAPAGPGGGEGGGGAKPNGGPGLPRKSEGRPPTAGKPPHIEQKDGGTRSTIAES